MARDILSSILQNNMRFDEIGNAYNDTPDNYVLDRNQPIDISNEIRNMNAANKSQEEIPKSTRQVLSDILQMTNKVRQPEMVENIPIKSANKEIKGDISTEDLKATIDKPMSEEDMINKELQDSLENQRMVAMMAGLGKAASQIGSGFAGLGAKTIIKPTADYSSMEDINKINKDSILQKIKMHEDRKSKEAARADKEQARQDRLDARAERKTESEANRDLRKLMGGNNLQLRQSALDLKENEETKNRIEKFSKRLEKSNLPEQINSLNNINKIMNNLGGSIYEMPKKDIPGIGLGVSSLPDILVSGEGVDLRQNITNLSNALLKSRSGAAVSEPEFKRFLKEASTGNFSREADTMKFIKKMADLVQQETGNIESYDPEIKKAYKDYTGEDLPSEKINFRKTDQSANDDTKIINGIKYKRATKDGKSGWMKVE